MNWVPQWLWPHADGSEPLPADLGPIAHAPTAAHLDFITTELHRQQDREADRDRSAQGRLTALLGLASTSGALTTAFVGFGLSTTRLDVTRVQLAALLAVIAYMGLQFVAAMYHTSRGLLPREYLELSPAVLDPKQDEAVDVFRTAILSTQRSNLRRASWVTNRRLDDMSCAIRAFQHAAVGAGLLLAVIALAILNRRFEVCLPLPW